MSRFVDLDRKAREKYESQTRKARRQEKYAPSEIVVKGRKLSEIVVAR